MTVKIDCAKWHYETKSFPKNSPPEAGATHIGMFFAWLSLRGFLGDELCADLGPEIELLRARTIAPGEFVWKFLDGSLSDHDLSSEGKAFAKSYYLVSEGGFVAEYEVVCKKEGWSDYATPDNWRTYELLKPLVDRRYSDWNNARRGRSI